jgi:hypothetical protein
MVRRAETPNNQTPELQDTDETTPALAITSTRGSESPKPKNGEKQRPLLASGSLKRLLLTFFLLSNAIPGTKASAQEIDNEALRTLDTQISLVSDGINRNDKDAINDVAKLLALNSDIIEASQDEDEPRIEDDTPEIIDAFDGDLAAFAFNTGEFPEIDEILETILENVDAELLENKQISFDEITVTDGQLVNKDGSPFEIPIDAAQNVLSQLVENLPDGSTVSINFIIDNLTQDDEGNLSVVLGFTVTYTSEVPTEGGRKLKRTDITYLNGNNEIQIVQGTPVPGGVTTNLTLTTAGEISSALAEKGITLNAEDFETVLVETMTRVNGGKPQEIIIRVIYGDIIGEPSVITPTSAKITVPSGINIRTEPNTRSATQNNTSPFEAATFADFAPGSDLTGFVLNNDGHITINDGTYEWIVLRNPNWTQDRETESRLLYAAFADRAIVVPAIGIPMPNISVENAGSVVSPTQEPIAQPAPEPDLTDKPNANETPPPPVGGGEGVGEVPPVAVTPEAMFGFDASSWRNLAFSTPEGVITVDVNTESFMTLGPNNSVLMPGVYNLDYFRSINSDPRFIQQIENYFAFLVNWANENNTFIVAGVVLRTDLRDTIIATKDSNGNLLNIAIGNGLMHIGGYDQNATGPLFGIGSNVRDLRVNNDGMYDPNINNYAVKQGDFVIFLAQPFIYSGMPGGTLLNMDYDEYLRFITQVQPISTYNGGNMKRSGISAAIVNARTGRRK